MKENTRMRLEQKSQKQRSSGSSSTFASVNASGIFPATTVSGGVQQFHHQLLTPSAQQHQ